MTHHYSHVDEREKRAAASRVLDAISGTKGVEKGVVETISTGATTETTAEVC